MSQRDTDTGTSRSIPCVDLHEFEAASDEARQTIGRNVDQICRSTGFLLIRNHGVPSDVVSSAWQSASQFFALTEEEKCGSQSGDAGCPRGYFPMASETLAKTLNHDTPPDLKESFSCGPLLAPTTYGHVDHFDFFYGDNIWPAAPAVFEETFITYYKAMEDLGRRLMKLFATALDLGPDYFEAMHSHHISALRALSYPPRPGAQMPGQQGAGAHTDYGSVTILRPDPNVPGLEVRMPDGTWIKAPHVENGFIVNIGDMLARWTNDRWVSTLHRVVTSDIDQRRQSLAFFYNPNYDANIRCLPSCLQDGEAASHPPVLAGTYLMQKFAAAQ